MRVPVIIPIQNEAIWSVFHPSSCQSASSPAILLLHGFAGHKAGRFRMLFRLANLLSKAGFHVLRIDFRGAGESDGVFEETTLARLKEDAVAGLQWLEKKCQPNRFFVHGNSLAAITAMQLAAERRVDAASLWVPVFDATPWKEGRLPKLMPNQTMLQEMEQLDMGKIAQQIAIPLFHLHSGLDETLDRWHRDQYDRYFDKPTHQGYFCPQADHTFSRQEDQNIVLEETLLWWKTQQRLKPS